MGGLVGLQGDDAVLRRGDGDAAVGRRLATEEGMPTTPRWGAKTVRVVRMVERIWLAGAGFEDVWSQVVDPLYIEAASSPERLPVRPEPVLDLLALWVLHGVTARSGIEALLVEEPMWMAARVASAARAFGHEDIAILWERMTRSVDLPAQRGKAPSEVQFSDTGAARELADALVVGRHADLNVELVNWIRAHADGFVDD